MSSVHQRDKPFNCDGTTIIEERWEIHIIIWRGNIAIINASGKVNIIRIGARTIRDAFKNVLAEFVR